MLELSFVGFLALACVSFLAASMAYGVLRYLNADPGDSHRTQLSTIQKSANRTLTPDVETELERLRVITAQVPVLLWLQSKSGAINWANSAYMDLADQIHPDRTGTWPLAPVFKATSLAQPGSPGARRMAVDIAEDNKGWFDVYAFRFEDEALYSAVPIDMTIKAERSLRSFVQTLTGTFAHLQVGLAIFDKRRQLVLFNPALIDLTTLEPEWLSSRPLLTEVLDRLRDKNMLPEPRDYKDWRDRLSTLEAAANQGLFEETWALASGQTYRMQARPHFDGGIAITLEDVSSELSLTRRFRSELELGQTVIDEIGPALAVFNERGQLVLTSKAYDVLFDLNDGNTLSTPAIADTTKLWQEIFDPSPIWGDIRELGRSEQPRSPWEDTVRQRASGQLYTCRFVPLPGAMTLIIFEPETVMAEVETAR
ncbi:MAG: PAS-domain containing protein [Dinoroseobacter sp.]|nr:PAS-domain containing protein [Dinoroseobacter sp.]